MCCQQVKFFFFFILGMFSHTVSTNTILTSTMTMNEEGISGTPLDVVSLGTGEPLETATIERGGVPLGTMPLETTGPLGTTTLETVSVMAKEEEEKEEEKENEKEAEEKAEVEKEEVEEVEEEGSDPLIQTEDSSGSTQDPPHPPLLQSLSLVLFNASSSVLRTPSASLDYTNPSPSSPSHDILLSSSSTPDISFQVTEDYPTFPEEPFLSINENNLTSTHSADSYLNITGEFGGSVFLPCTTHHSMERQVSTGTGILSRLVDLNVVVPKAVIPGHGEYHIDTGSTITLDCYIHQSLVAPQYIFWYHNSRMINYDRERGGVNVQIDTGPQVRSRLTVTRATPADSGNYTCAAANSEPAYTTVYITHDNKIAAIQPRGAIDSSPRNYNSCLSIVLLLLLIQLLNYNH